MDTLTDIERSDRMRRIKSENTGIEYIVRRLIYSLGHRYRLHRRDLPGVPDIVFNKQKKIILVHGCFWHRHSDNCKKTRLPKSNQNYWIKKFEINQKRDVETYQQLCELGWNVLVIWECEIKDKQKLTERLNHFLGVSNS